jgi:hypothetical protein
VVFLKVQESNLDVLDFTPSDALTNLLGILIIYFLPSRADSLESKVEELAQRLENQTAEVIRLTLELEEYEYKDFGTANNSNHNKDDDEEEGDSDYEYVDDGKDPAW